MVLVKNNSVVHVSRDIFGLDMFKHEKTFYRRAATDSSHKNQVKTAPLANACQ